MIILKGKSGFELLYCAEKNCLETLRAVPDMEDRRRLLQSVSEKIEKEAQELELQEDMLGLPEAPPKDLDPPDHGI